MGKTIIILLLSLFYLTSSNTFGQKKGKGASQYTQEIPNFVLVEGANPAVVLYLGYTSVHDQVCFDILKKEIDKQLNLIGIKPKVYVNYMGPTEVGSESNNSKSNALLNDSESHYILFFTLTSLPQIKKNSTEELKLEDFQVPFLSIYEYLGESLVPPINPGEKRFMISGYNMKTILEDIEKRIKEKPKTYFEAVEFKEFEFPEISGAKDFEFYPKDLKKEKLLLIQFEQGDRPMYNSWNAKYQNMMKSYPFEYAMISKNDFSKYKNMGYKYILIIKESTTIKQYLINGMPDHTEIVPTYKYFFKDLNSGNTYASADVVFHTTRSTAFRKMLKWVNKQYGL